MKIVHTKSFKNVEKDSGSLTHFADPRYPHSTSLRNSLPILSATRLTHGRNVLPSVLSLSSLAKSIRTYRSSYISCRAPIFPQDCAISNGCCELLWNVCRVVHVVTLTQMMSSSFFPSGFSSFFMLETFLPVTSTFWLQLIRPSFPLTADTSRPQPVYAHRV